MKKIWIGQAGSYYLLFGGELGKPAMLLNLDSDEIVLTHYLENNSWHHGEYMFNFDEAYKKYKEEYCEK